MAEAPALAAHRGPLMHRRPIKARSGSELEVDERLRRPAAEDEQSGDDEAGENADEDRRPGPSPPEAGRTCTQAIHESPNAGPLQDAGWIAYHLRNIACARRQLFRSSSGSSR